ncbi:MAG TPA: hotdog fold thioesterase [Anaerolineae bacterium]|nr:hotdog fold thioesterase [Caldilineae bacterium]HID33007.1 hotdog fold thioesterase [Anaerolineae bacterium]HIQ12136.1 hotdog fold thioesterase [Caldilineales bacterium]
MIWKYPPDLAALNQTRQHTAVAHMGIQFSAIGDDWLEATMPVDHRTKQPAGILHGGATALLAETIGSVASVLIIDWPQQQAVGIELNISHLRSVSEGQVTGRVQPIRIGRRTHVWDIRIRDDRERLIAVARLTMAILSPPMSP